MALLNTTAEELLKKATITIDEGVRGLSLEDLKIVISEEPLATSMSIEEVLTWFDKLFEANLAIGTLGAGFTFSVIVSDLHDPSSSDFTADQVRKLLALAWLLFVVAIGAACAASLLFTFQRNWFIDFAGHRRRKFATATTSLVLQLLILAPFMVSGWAVKAYVGDVGLAAFILTGVFAGCAVLIWILQTL